MATVRAALKTWSADKKGRHLVLIGIEAENKTRYISLGFKILKSHWNPKAKRVRASHAHAESFNEEIEAKLHQAEEVLSELRREGGRITVDRIKAALDPGRKSFWEYADRWLDEKRQAGQVYYWRRCRAVLRKFKEAVGDDLQWSEMTVVALKNFDAALKKKGNSANTRHGAFRVIRTIVQDAIRESVINRTEDPFEHFKRPKLTSNRHYKVS